MCSPLITRMLARRRLPALARFVGRYYSDFSPGVSQIREYQFNTDFVIYFSNVFHHLCNCPLELALLRQVPVLALRGKHLHGEFGWFMDKFELEAITKNVVL